MPRQGRVFGESKVYHVMVRGNARSDIFIDKEDRNRFIQILMQKNEAMKYSLYAYCLMDNHIHLLIHEGEDEISKIMHRINVTYAVYFNKKYNRVGHVFQDRFKSEVIKDDSQLLAALRYIHNNPVKANIVSSPLDYKWSSYSAYIEGAKSTPLIDTSFVLNTYFSGEGGRIDEFNEFSKLENDDTFIDYKEEAQEEKTLTTESMVVDYIEKFCKRNKINLENINLRDNIAIKDKLIINLKKESNLSIRQLARILGIDRNIIQRAKN